MTFSIHRRRLAAAASIVSIVAAATSLSACGDNAPGHHSASGDLRCDYSTTPSQAKPGTTVPSGDPATEDVTLTLETNRGEIPIELHADKAPCTVATISHLAREGYYDNTICHRLTTSGLFVLQCGDPTGTGSGNPGFKFADEWPVGESHKGNLYHAGSVAMANSGPNTNGSQFFINYEDSPLQPDYTIFGEVTGNGLDVVRAIAEKGTVDDVPSGPPAESVEIIKARVN